MSWSRTLKIRQILRAQLEAGDPITLLFSDLRGFTAFTAARGDQAAFRLSQRHEETLRAKIDERGIFVKSFGDGVMAAFAEAVDAVEAAVDIQETVREENQRAPREGVDVGIGIASGAPVMTDVDFIGHSVNLAQRLSAIAKGGQILVSDGVRERVTLPSELEFLPLGQRNLRGVGREGIAEVVWLREAARVSDERDRVTLILTEAGTLYIEVAKDPKQALRDALREMRGARRDEEGFPAAFLQRLAARIAETGLPEPVRALDAGHEFEIRQVSFDYRRRTLIVNLPDGELTLAGVGRADAERFFDQARRLGARRDV